MRQTMLAPTVLLGSRECALPPLPRLAHASSPEQPARLEPRRTRENSAPDASPKARASAA
jgi:hypothetical protein